MIPTNIYEYAVSFRSIYTRSMPMLKKIADPNLANSDEIQQLYGKAQSLAVQISMSNEHLLKAILLASTGRLVKGHNLKELIYKLDKRYVDIIKNHLESNGLVEGRMDLVLDTSAETFVTARYGFEGGKYELDFRTLQLLNEVLDDIFNNRTPDWTTLTREQQQDSKKLAQELDLIFNVDYQKERAKQLRAWHRAFKE